MKLSEAEHHLVLQSRQHPVDAASGMYQLGKIYKESGDSKRADAFFREALKLDPSLLTAAKQIKELKNKLN